MFWYYITFSPLAAGCAILLKYEPWTDWQSLCSECLSLFALLFPLFSMALIPTYFPLLFISRLIGSNRGPRVCPQYNTLVFILCLFSQIYHDLSFQMNLSASSIYDHSKLSCVLNSLHVIFWPRSRIACLWGSVHVGSLTKGWMESSYEEGLVYLVARKVCLTIFWWSARSGLVKHASMHAL